MCENMYILNNDRQENVINNISFGAYEFDKFDKFDKYLVFKLINLSYLPLFHMSCVYFLREAISVMCFV